MSQTTSGLWTQGLEKKTLEPDCNKYICTFSLAARAGRWKWWLPPLLDNLAAVPSTGDFHFSWEGHNYKAGGGEKTKSWDGTGILFMLKWLSSLILYINLSSWMPDLAYKKGLRPYHGNNIMVNNLNAALCFQGLKRKEKQKRETKTSELARLSEGWSSQQFFLFHIVIHFINTSWSNSLEHFKIRFCEKVINS